MIALPLLGPSRQRGMATLITVMVLVLVMSITFAFANRSLIFEQRTGANQVRSTQALEIAEAGIEWALAQLNGSSKLDDSCTAVSTTSPTFSSRYLQTASDGTLQPKLANANWRPACVIGANGLFTCSCRTASSPVLAGAGGHFSIRFSAVGGTQPDVIRMTAHGCTDANGTLDGRCIPGGSNDTPADGYAEVSILVAKIPPLAGGPVAGLTARGDVKWQGAGPSVHIANTDLGTNGVTINSGGTVDSGAQLVSIPGTPPALSVVGNDPTLNSSAISGDAFFASMIGMSKNTFYNLDSTTKFTSNTGLSAALDSAINGSNKATRIWIGPDPATGVGTASYDLQGTYTYGTENEPVIIVVNGSVKVGGNTTINGLLYSTAAVWDNQGGGNSFLHGAAVAENEYKANGSMDIVYNAKVMEKLKSGDKDSIYTRIPGSWTD